MRLGNPIVTDKKSISGYTANHVETIIKSLLPFYDKIMINYKKFNHSVHERAAT